MAILIKRIYLPAEDSDGKRVLIDRLWPRGVSKERARLDAWLKDVAPSPALREWFGHKAENFARFKTAYQEELEQDGQKQAAVAQLLAWEKEGTVTLLYGAKDPAVNHAVVL